ncbi:4Fe-4S dicluster domain-containing protein [Ilumatobacter sp.]|uniref:4Fe-4S dicluster domain-containing protein n=1 Tax=Ilumatobacter sp. TaxID=1967498 RepID=UPI003B52C9A1
MTVLGDRSGVPSGLVAHDDLVVASGERAGFFTDTSVCIGCKACEVACKEWNDIPSTVGELSGDSYDNTGALGATTWRHVTFIEQARHRQASGTPAPDLHVDPVAPGEVTLPTALTSPDGPASIVWLMSSDVCKHCTEAGCLDVCPTGSLFRSEFGTVVVQPDICNGCGYCVPACPFGVIGRDESTGGAAKCTLCYDRLKGDQTPACAHACPTDSIQFGPLDEMRRRAHQRLGELHDAGDDRARLYGEDPSDGVGGSGAVFLLRDEPEVYGLPPAPVVASRELPRMWASAAMAAATLVGGIAAAALGGRR